MAIRMRRGLLGELDESKLLAGEWAVTIDAETNRQQVLMCFGAGIVKRMGTYNDFSDMIAEISGDLLNSYKVELEMIKSAVETMASEVNSDKEEVVIIHDGIVNTLMPQIEQYAISTQTSAENASISEQNASRYATNSLDSAELSAEFSDLAKSYAKGGTGLREGEETDNAKYYMEQAKAAAGGDYIATSEKGQAGGVATLNADGKVPAEQLPEMGGNVVVDGTSITQDEETKAISVAKEIIDDIADLKDNKADAKDLTDHTDSLVMSADGVHGLRYYDEKLEALDEAGNWNEIETGGGGVKSLITVTTTDFIGKEVTCVSEDESLTSVFDENGNANFKVSYLGDYRITCEGKTKVITIDVLGGVYSLEFNLLKIVTWADGSWDDISKMLEAHYNGEIDISDYWSVGDIRMVDVSTISAMPPLTDTHSEGSYEFQILGFAHDNLADGSGKSAITIWQKTGFNNKGMPIVADSRGNSALPKWEDSDRRMWCRTNYFNALPVELSSLIKNVKKLSQISTSSSSFLASLIETEETVSILSIGEVLGDVNSNNAKFQDGEQYDFFKTESNRMYIPMNAGLTNTRTMGWKTYPSCVPLMNGVIHDDLLPAFRNYACATVMCL